MVLVFDLLIITLTFQLNSWEVLHSAIFWTVVTGTVLFLPSIECIQALFSVCFVSFCEVAVGVGESDERDQSAPTWTAPQQVGFGSCRDSAGYRHSWLVMVFQDENQQIPLKTVILLLIDPAVKCRYNRCPLSLFNLRNTQILTAYAVKCRCNRRPFPLLPLTQFNPPVT